MPHGGDMTASPKTSETIPHRNARIVGAWRRTNKLMSESQITRSDRRALIEGGVLRRIRGGHIVWSDAAVNLRSLREMSDFLKAA